MQSSIDLTTGEETLVVLDGKETPEEKSAKVLAALRMAKERFQKRSRPRTLLRGPDARSRAADPKRRRRRQRGLLRLHRKPTAEQLRAVENWKRSKVGRAEMRRRRRDAPTIQSAEAISDAILERKQLTALRRAYRRGTLEDLLCPTHDMGMESVPCTCEEKP